MSRYNESELAISSISSLITEGKTATFSPESMKTTEIMGDTIDHLVVQGIEHILTVGEEINVNKGHGRQARNVTYTLMDSRARVHTLRTPWTDGYQAAELLVFFKGSLSVRDGLEAISPFWTSLADEDGDIQSNYGYHVFYQEIRDKDGLVVTNADGTPMTQYDWVLAALERKLEDKNSILGDGTNNLQSRRGIINLNQPQHKIPTTSDFPCVIGAHYFVEKDDRGNPSLCCVVSSRSSDAVTGLCNNLFFFSFLGELIYADLVQRGHSDLLLGYTQLKANFTQVYDRTRNRMEANLRNYSTRGIDLSQTRMPPISDAQAMLHDIYEGTATTAVSQWLCEKIHAFGRGVSEGIVYELHN